MNSSPFRRVLALFLCCQPVLWMSNVALAQTIQDGLFPPQSSLPTDRSSSSADSRSPARAGSDPATPREMETEREERPFAPPSFATTAVDAPIDPEQYVCGPGDVFELDFWGAQNFKLRVAVDLEGRAFVPRVGYFAVGGKSLMEARQMIREALGRYFPRVSFEVALATPRTFLVQVVGGVARPASYLARAVERVAAVVDRAGGFVTNGSRRRIEIRRRSGAVVNADLHLFVLTGDVRYNPYVLDGDVVRVPFVEVAATIEGAVNRPGSQELVGARDLAELVDLAGGMHPDATQLLPVSIVRRLSDDRREQMLVPFVDGKLPEVRLGHEDIVRIPSVNELHQSVMVIGAIAGAQLASGQRSAGKPAPEEASATRRLPFVQGDSVRSLLQRAGGVLPLADLSGSYILRNGETLPVDLRALMMLRDLSADRPVELGDTLVVPFMRRNVYVLGAVFNPGEYPYTPAFRIAEYLAVAGGKTRMARSVDRVRVVTPGGETKKYSRDLSVEPGSTVIVPERTFTHSEVVQIVLGVASVIISASAIALASRK
jgi:protein involved in polysaccharide export with SLBB domain